MLLIGSFATTGPLDAAWSYRCGFSEAVQRVTRAREGRDRARDRIRLEAVFRAATRLSNSEHDHARANAREQAAERGRSGVDIADAGQVQDALARQFDAQLQCAACGLDEATQCGQV